ncbi:DUF4864 domain-containing protein [Marivita hallyeonensis]|uniref:DUF4864 domain-containing protein n=1 Tax=Marivita hallyeonensis TaxID=996342 RepID=A0A1M5NLT1_9RHOB|nr:DUF4864 domain-containing protein [Marivita hallyeonensis]SHG90159.1 protein of unknown function [Marivita hallyeonensis]
MRTIITGLTLALTMTGSLWAQDVLGREPAIEETIQSQIDAFLQDDFETAFTFASPNIRNMFRTPENFGRMVQQGYPMVWRPDTVTYGDLRSIAGGLYQMVIVKDVDGNLHYLDYRMQQIDGEWRIAGVQILQPPEVSA